MSSELYPVTFNIIVASTAAVLAVGTATAYLRTGDILHPMLFLGPLFLYSAAVDPWMVREHLPRFFAEPRDVELVLVLNLLGVIALVLGATHRDRRHRQRLSQTLRDEDRRRLVRFAQLLAVVALVAYTYGIVNAGGFVEAFSRSKGGGRSGSGYIGEAMNLGLVCAAMMAISRYRRGWTVPTLLMVLVGILPNLIQGTFGGRRGPLFIALTALAVACLITRRRKPSLLVLCASLGVVGLSIQLVASQRQFLYLGSDRAAIDWGAFERTLTTAEVTEGNNFVYGAGFVLATRYSGQFTWGRELLVNLLVRPIPRQIWPTKYEDAGATWITNETPGLGPMSSSDWLNSVGWLPQLGSSAISISDLYGEFAWGAVVVMYFLGRGFALVRARSQAHGGLWDLLHLEGLMMSIYLATQSFSAFYHRYLILAVPTILIWHLAVRRRARAGLDRTAAPAARMTLATK